MRKIRKVNITLPTLAEQKRIVTKAQKLMKLCDELEEKIKQSKILEEKILNSVVYEVLSEG